MSDVPPPSSQHRQGLWPRLLAELRTYGFISGYLYVCFLALMLYKAALLEEAGMHVTLLGVALLKALVIGKFVLIGDAMHKATKGHAGRMLARIATRVFWLMVILVLFTLAEELLLGVWHGQSAAEIGADLHARSMMEALAEILLMLLILVPLVAASEVNQALGPGRLAGLLMKARASTTASGHDPGCDGH